MAKDIINDKWIKIELGILISSDSLVEFKRLMKDYAEELDWIVEVDKEGVVSESGGRLYEVKASPPKSGMISPEELRKIYDKLKGFSFNLLRRINPDEEYITYVTQPIKLIEAKNSEEVKLGFSVCEVLNIEYLLADRIRLEKKDYNLEKFLFFESVQSTFDKFNLKKDLFRDFFLKKDIKKAKEDIRERLLKWFNIRA